MSVNSLNFLYVAAASILLREKKGYYCGEQ